MQSAFAESIKHRADAGEAQAILRSCVHCGFCLAACPTYQLLGDELDSPRGRIYLTKQLLESGLATPSTRLHLDRCLACRACESACPSGVRYGRLLDIGRSVLAARDGRPAPQALVRYLLRKLIPYRRRVRALVGLARLARPLLPAHWRSHVPARPAPEARPWPAPRHARRVLLLQGCVQPVLAPQIDAAAARVLDRLGISALRVPGAGCCGAVAHHLGAEADARAQLRRNVDALWPGLAAGAAALVSGASACSAMLRDYGRLLADDPGYAARAADLSARVRDLSEVVAAEHERLRALLPPPMSAVRVAFQAPCTLQHALRLAGTVEALLRTAGYELTAVADGQGCCGAAGTYFILQPVLSARLRAAKVAALMADAPELIATANIGCLQQLRSAAALPVRHWIELIDARLADG
jgi:glycolate oxidase iron-sulfur subunit